MNIENIKTLTIVGNKVVINNIDNEVSIFLNDSIDAVQYHKGYKLLEEPLMNEVEFDIYQEFIDLWQLAEDKKNRILTEEEIAQQELEAKIAEAKVYLASTDFKMTVDYFATLTAEQQSALTTSRAEARAFLVANGY